MYHTKSKDVHDYLENLYEKTFEYQKPAGDDTWKLPDNTETLYSEFYQFDELQQLKERLNSVKSKLNHYSAEEWTAHKKRTSPTGEITWRLKNETKAEFVTVAFCKFFESLHRYELVPSQPKFNSLHLCEAPGAFIAALNHYLYTTYDKEKIKWSWLATTLNPYYEGNPLNKMIIDDRFILHTLDNWIFYPDFTGNLVDPDHIEYMKQECAKKFPDGVQLITADGSIDCAEVPDVQEDYVATLHFTEILTALSILTNGGNFMVKLFTMFESCSVCIMYLLNCAFESVHVFKPATSKQGNSEVYVICLGFKKHSTAMLAETLEIMESRLVQDLPNALPLFAKTQLPREFLLQHEICCRRFMNLQIEAIEASIQVYHAASKRQVKFSHELRRHVSNLYYKRYKVQKLPDDFCILQRGIEERIKTAIRKGSLEERETIKKLELSERVFRLKGELNEVIKLQKQSGDGLVELFENEAAVLHIYRGTPVRTVHSSLFATLPTMLLRSQLLELFNEDPIWSNTPNCVLDGEIKINAAATPANENNKVQQKFFVELLRAIIETQPSALTFNSFPFLTHYAASILKFLCSNVYRSVEFACTPRYTITLSKPREHAYDGQLQELCELLESDERIHCVLKIPELHRNQFAKALINHNDGVLIECLKSVLAD